MSPTLCPMIANAMLHALDTTSLTLLGPLVDL